jgi:hypothetical protein
MIAMFASAARLLCNTFDSTATPSRVRTERASELIIRLEQERFRGAFDPGLFGACAKAVADLRLLKGTLQTR